MAKVAQNSLFNLLRQRRRGDSACFEYYISALDIGRNPVEAKRFKRFSKLIHLDPLVSANVDPAKQRNVDWHVPIKFLNLFKLAYEF
jgi:hypothetical protein